MNGLEYGDSGSDFSAANNVMMNGVLLGCHNGLKVEDMEYVTKIIVKYIEQL